MKFDLDQLTKLLSRLRYGDRIHPVRDWFALLGLGLLLFVGSLLWNLWLFAQVTAGEPIGSAPASPQLAAPAVDSVQTLFQQRATEADNYKGAYRFVDPSL